MFERMLNKQEVPTVEKMTLYCGENGERFLDLNEWLSAYGETEQQLSFPYGNNYGWAVTHRKKKKLICHVFPENGAFSVMLRLTNKQFESVYEEMKENTQECIDRKYPCNEGGWIHYRVKCNDNFKDIQTLLALKCGNKEKV